MSNPTGGRLKFCHAALLGTTALVCLSVVEPVFAETFNVDADSDKTSGADIQPLYGVIAQEIEKMHPKTVYEGPDGYLRVGYGKIQ